MTRHVTNYRKKQGVKTESVSPEYICQETGQKSNGKALFFPSHKSERRSNDNQQIGFDRCECQSVKNGTF